MTKFRLLGVSLGLGGDYNQRTAPGSLTVLATMTFLRDAHHKLNTYMIQILACRISLIT